MLDVGEKNDLALNRFEARERSEQTGSQVRALELLQGTGALLRSEVGVERNSATSSDRAKSIERTPVNDREQPGGEPLGLAAGRELLVRVHECLLRDVVGVGWVTDDGQGACERGPAMSPHQHLERVLSPRQRSVN